MSPAHTIASEAKDLSISDTDYHKGIAFLREACPAYQRRERELAQCIIDNLCAANMLIEACISKDINGPHSLQTVSTERLRLLQEINETVMARIRA